MKLATAPNAVLAAADRCETIVKIRLHKPFSTRMPGRAYPPMAMVRACFAASIPWNKGKLLGQKPPLKPKEIWTSPIRLQLERRTRELALFNLAIDDKLRGCDLVRYLEIEVDDALEIAEQTEV